MNIKLPIFKDQTLLNQAFTHRSYLNESKNTIESNERLEFLGDSILSFLISRHLYKEFPLFNEGVLTNLRSLLVNTKSLAEQAGKLGFGEFLKLSKGEHEAQGRKNQSILADSFEAFVGALYLDQGLETVEQFVKDTLLENILQLVEQKTLKDPKSLLQEYVQSKKKGSPFYRVIQELGPAHAKQFTVQVLVGNLPIGEGKGKSKQQAEEEAAQQALEKISDQW